MATDEIVDGKVSEELLQEALSNKAAATSTNSPTSDVVPHTRTEIGISHPATGLLLGLIIVGDDRLDDLAVSVYNAASAVAKASGKGDDVMPFMEQVVDYMSRTPWLSGTRVHCHFLLTCAMLYDRRYCPEEALRARILAQKIAAGRPEMQDLETLAWFSLAEKYRFRGEERLSHSAYRSMLALLESRQLSSEFASAPDLHTPEELRMMGCACFRVGRATDCIDYLTEALRVEGGLSGTSRGQSNTLLLLSEFYFQTKFNHSQQASSILLQQALVGFQLEDCTCSTACLSGGCARHQLQAEAFEMQGIVQSAQGFLVEAERSYQQALALVEECGDKHGMARLHLKFLELYVNMGKGKTDTGISGGFLVNNSVRSFERLEYHGNEILKASAPGASLDVEQHALLLRDVGVHEFLKASGLGERVLALQKMLLMAEARGTFDGHAALHSVLSVTHSQMDNVEACKEEFFLALKFLETVPTSTDLLYVQQTLGHIAMRPGIRELNIAYEIWHKVICSIEENLQSMARLSEEHARHFFEVSKHTYMTMAWCQALRAKKHNLVDYMENALVWAERGKGRILMSLLAATQRTFASKLGPGTLDEVAVRNHNLNSRYLVDFENQFYGDTSFALDFIYNRPRTLSPFRPGKLVFVEYTFTDYAHLMIHVVTDSPTDIGAAHPISLRHAEVVSLLNIFDEGTRSEAEKELALVKERSRIDHEAGPESDTNGAQGWFKRQGRGAEEADMILSAMNTYGSRVNYFNPWIPGMTASIQRRVVEAQEKRKMNASFHNEEREMNRLLQSLYAALYEPIKETVSGICNPEDTLVFVPHEDLGLVPFAALHEPGGAYLIEQYAVSVSPSIWCMRHCQNLYDEKVHSGRSQGAAVLVGRMSGYPPGWPNLTEAHKEVNAVQSFCGLTPITVLDDTPEMDVHMKEKVMELLPDASWIHFSVHGQFSSRYPQGSLLLGDSDSKRLTAAEIISSSAPSLWRARAAIVSASQTGLGSLTGEGILGFATAFTLAGGPTCVLAMWEVNEKFCTNFMGEFYGQLCSGDNIAHAMQKTMVTMMRKQKKSRNPKVLERFKKISVQPAVPLLEWSVFDWAAFTCFGFPGVTVPNVHAN